MCFLNNKSAVITFLNLYAGNSGLNRTGLSVVLVSRISLLIFYYQNFVTFTLLLVILLSISIMYDLF